MDDETFARIDRKLLSFVREHFGDIAEDGNRYLITSEGVVDSPSHRRWWASALGEYGAARDDHFRRTPDVVIDFLLTVMMSPEMIDGGGCHLLLDQERRTALHDWAARLPGWDDKDPPIDHIDAWAMLGRVAAAAS